MDSPIAHCTTKLFRSGHYSFPEGILQGFTAHYELQENALNVSLGRERIGNCGEESVFVVVGKRVFGIVGKREICDCREESICGCREER
ncbi:MAG: hypothetical protein II202_02790 [Bacteroidales bacterium]|nr:hypothetical protein [Bacteroidales bacterium]